MVFKTLSLGGLHNPTGFLPRLIIPVFKFSSFINDRIVYDDDHIWNVDVSNNLLEELGADSQDFASIFSHNYTCNNYKEKICCTGGKAGGLVSS